MLDKETNVTLYLKRDTKSIPLFNQALALVYHSDMKQLLLILVWTNMTLTHGGYS